MSNKFFYFSTLALSLMLSASVATAKGKAAGKKSLYERLGGKEAITAVVNSFVDTTANNEKVNFYRNDRYKGMDVPKLKDHLVKFISEKTGGPKEYKGRTMKVTHKGMDITAEEFSAIAADLAATLDQFKVPKTEKDELMAIAASTQDEIVAKKK